MRRHSNRILYPETLENRCVLNGAPIDFCMEPSEIATVAPPPPAGQDAIDAVVVTKYSTNHIRVRDSAGGTFMQVQGRRAPENGFADPFMTEDFNDDGVTDVLSVDSVGDWWLYLNDGQELHERFVGAGLVGVEHLGTADFNQDGRLDIVSYDDTVGELWVSLNRSSGFEHQNWGEFRNPNGWSSLHMGDYNGDGLMDVLAGEVGGHWWLAQNNGGTDFNNYRWGRYADYGWVDTLDGEFNGDQYSDIVVRAPDNTWWLWAGTESGFENAVYFGHWRMRGEWKDVATGDFDGDQIDDVVGRSTDGRLWVGSATESGFQTWAWATGWIESADWSRMTVLDINGDGMEDQVGHAKDDTWWYALSQGGRFQNEFWQKGGQGDFVAQGFQPDATVDVSASFIDVLDAPGTETEPEIQGEIADAYATVVDGRVVLNGAFEEFAGLEVTSLGGYLALETFNIPPLGEVPLANPFGPAEGIIVQNTPNAITVGVLGADRRIDIEGEIPTSVLYSGPVASIETDLQVKVGLKFEIFSIPTGN